MMDCIEIDRDGGDEWDSSSSDEWCERDLHCLMMTSP